MLPRKGWAWGCLRRKTMAAITPSHLGATHSLTPSEKNYHTSKLEYLALKWSVTDHFKEYLVCMSFVVRTDNNPLT